MERFSVNGETPEPPHPGPINLDWSSGALAEGLRCYRQEKFFAAHEHWESVWLTCLQPEKTFLQALIQVAAAFHHLRRNNLRGAASLLKTSLGKLERYPAQFAGVESGILCEELGVWLRALTGGQPHAPLPVPEIRFISKSLEGTNFDLEEPNERSSGPTGLA